MSKRIEWIDVAKGILIVLVVLGHSDVNTVVKILINSFHMAAFFFLSGVTFKYTDDVKIFIKKKIKGLLIPYFAFCCLLLFYQFAKTLFFKGTSFDLASGLISIILPISGRESTTTYGLWFLPCLFISEIVCYFLLNNITKRKRLSVLGIIILCCFCVSIHTISDTTSILSILPIALLFLLLGFALKKFMCKIQQKAILTFVMNSCFFLLCIGLNWMVNKQTVDLSSMSLGFWPVYLFGGLFGTIAVCALSMIVFKCRFFQCLGKDSLYYYGLHYEAIGVIEKIFRGGVLQTFVCFAVLIPIVIVYKKVKALVWGESK